MSKYLIWVTVCLISIILIVYFRPPWTRPIYSIDGKKAIAQLEEIELGKLKQSILIRSTHTKNPILLFIHGGPGMPLMYLSHSFQRPLEERFMVVHWDQRGAGKSYSPDIPVNTIHVEQYLSDALQLIDTLRARYHQRKIFLVGHSWGTYLSSILVHRHPELFHAYISVGQVVDSKMSRTIQKQFLFAKAKQANDTSLIRKLQDTSFTNFENYLFQYGGELKNSTSYMPLVITGLASTEYTFQNVLDVAKGPQFCAKHMRYNAIKGSILNEVKNYEVPVFFLTGSYDYTTPAPLIDEYYQKIQAPTKEMIWFDESAHFPFYEEPNKFDSVLIHKILKMMKE